MLSALRRAGPPFQLTPGALLRATLVTSGTMTNRIDRLASAGLVYREPDPSDRRGVLVTLSERGRSVVDAALTDLLDREQALLAGPQRRPAAGAGRPAADPPGPVRRRRSVRRRPSGRGTATPDAAEQPWPREWPSLEVDMAHLLGAEALHLEFPTKVVFDSVTLGLNEGDRVGIVGRNGDGKSSLLRHARRAAAARLRAGHRPRRGDGGRARPGRRPRRRAHGRARGRRRHARARVGGRRPRRGRDPRPAGRRPVGRAGRHAQRRPAPPGRAGRRCSPGTGTSCCSTSRPTTSTSRRSPGSPATSSGAGPPTAGGLVVVTHDRWFLDEVCTATWEVHDRIVEPFEGGYAAYILQRVERDRMAAASEAKRQNLTRKELAWLRRGAPARTSKPKFRIDAANALIADVPEIRDRVSLQSLAVARLGKDVVDLLDASVDYDGNQVLRRRRVADRAGRAHRHPRRQRRGQVHPARPRSPGPCSRAPARSSGARRSGSPPSRSASASSRITSTSPCGSCSAACAPATPSAPGRRPRS